jgi:zinc transporter ZupT
MNCADADQALIREPVVAKLPLDVQEHLRNCQACLKIVYALSAPVVSDEPSPVTLSQIEQRLVADLKVVRPVMPARHAVAFGAIFTSIVILGVYRLGAFAIQLMSPLQTGAMLGAIAVSAGVLIYSLVHQMAPGSFHRISPRMLPIGILTSLTVVFASLF